jgi:hypothetical protein
MRLQTRRLVLGVSIAVAAPLLAMLPTATAHAGTCYIVQTGPQSFTVCP